MTATYLENMLKFRKNWLNEEQFNLHAFKKIADADKLTECYKHRIDSSIIKNTVVNVVQPTILKTTLLINV